ISDWPNFLHRWVEIAQNNILAGPPRDHWLAKLIDESKEAGSFEDFDLKLVLDDSQITRLLRSKTDEEFRAHIHKEFLNWVERHAPDNGHKPADFAEKVRHGWQVGGAKGHPLAFYDVFCLFLREELKEETEVFRAFAINVWTGIQQDVQEIKQA